MSVSLLTSLPALDATDPDAVPLDAPAVASVGWSLLLSVLLLQSAALVVVRRAPATVLVAVAVLGVVPAASAGGTAGLTALPVGVAVVLLTLLVPPVRRWPALALAGALVATASAVNAVVALDTPLGLAVGQGVLQAVGTVGLPLLATLVVRSRREVRSARTAERHAMVDATLARERAAMARELHDIAAHHLSGIALMAGVVDRQIDTEPDKAHAGVRQVREQSTAVLDDLRRLVGLLRDDTAAGRSVETFAALPALVERAAVDARYTVLTDDPDAPVGAGVGPLAQLAAYRTVQEALTNAARHAAGSVCTVQVDDRSPDTVTVVVHNDRPGRQADGRPGRPVDGRPDGRAASSGFGLVGMRERAELVGATLSHGPAADGGWDVRLVLPRDGGAA
ncbi:hypothetical protein BIU90_01015 [Curtobacterium sp. MCBA15_001]|nr:hypothetical protein BIU90_01015 [Curtobacterium sp. MCBA15_001]